LPEHILEIFIRKKLAKTFGKKKKTCFFIAAHLSEYPFADIDSAARIVVIEHAKGNGRKEAGKIEENY
jgi:hypothetical protein